MRKLFCFIFALLVCVDTFAATSFTVKVSFTIPQRIEIKTAPCNDKIAPQDYNDAAKVYTSEQVTIRNNTQLLIQTVLPK